MDYTKTGNGLVLVFMPSFANLWFTVTAVGQSLFYSVFAAMDYNCMCCIFSFFFLFPIIMTKNLTSHE